MGFSTPEIKLLEQFLSRYWDDPVAINGNENDKNSRWLN